MAIETLAVRCEQSGRSLHFTLFERYDLRDEPGEKISYSSLANEFELKTTDVTNYLASVRRDFRKILLEKVRELTGTEDEFRAEARALLGVEVKCNLSPTRTWTIAAASRRIRTSAGQGTG